ncbi:hypothetical protein QYM36_006483 [Artemia franciscana]|uniref:Uncharacterized protein n=1 Tax=Artemia franciscana TaxID=6661 RepID=A0AA88HTI0_ARTSF|nr:hypothetical protein QYM36_006483 [Artemia franciscana]
MKMGRLFMVFAVVFAVVGVTICIQEHAPTYEIENVFKYPWSVHISRKTPALTVVCWFIPYGDMNVTLNEGLDMTKHEVDDYFSLIKTNQDFLLALLLKKSVKDLAKSNYWLQVTVTRDQGEKYSRNLVVYINDEEEEEQLPPKIENIVELRDKLREVWKENESNKYELHRLKYKNAHLELKLMRMIHKAETSIVTSKPKDDRIDDEKTAAKDKQDDEEKKG